MRDLTVDRAKGLLIILVVFGHFLERLVGWQTPFGAILLSSIYAVHMPAFIFVSGLLFKVQNWQKNLVFFLALFLPFQALYLAFNAIWTGTWQWNVTYPYWLLWYLFAMMAWTLLSISVGRHKLSIYLAIVASLAVGLSAWNNYAYSLGRILVFWPFFVLGQHYGMQILASLKQLRHVHYWLGAGLVILLGFASYSEINRYWLYGSLSYQQLHVDPMTGISIRLVCLAVAGMGTLLILLLAQQMKNTLAQLGRYTLPVYLLHGFVVLLCAQWLMPLPLVQAVLLSVLLTFLSCYILQQAIFDQLLRHLTLWLMWPYQKIFRR